MLVDLDGHFEFGIYCGIVVTLGSARRSAVGRRSATRPLACRLACWCSVVHFGLSSNCFLQVGHFEEAYIPGCLPPALVWS
jgi:hypothetical protein